MSQLLSDEIRAAISAIDANPNPTPEQIALIREAHRAYLVQLLDFTEDLELQRKTSQRAIPVWGEAGASARLYKWLRLGQRRPSAGMGALKIVGGYAS